MTIMRPIATALLFLAAPLLGLAQSIGGLTARATASSIALSPTSLEGAAIEDLQFSYSQDAGATWKPIEASCLEFVSGEAIWHVLECLQVDVFEGSNIQFKASVSNCNPVSFDGYTYEVIQIGSQCWFAENLRSTHYANGKPIPGNLTAGDWRGTRSGAQADYGNNRANLKDYGRLYNWFAVNKVWGLCPIGWHVPSDLEFITLEMELGMSWSVANSIGRRGTVGTRMKSSAFVSPGWGGTNLSGFSALPAGFRSSNGEFYFVGSDAFFWTSSPKGAKSWYRKLFSDMDNVLRFDGYRSYGFSVRCIRD